MPQFSLIILFALLFPQFKSYFNIIQIIIMCENIFLDQSSKFDKDIIKGEQKPQANIYQAIQGFIKNRKIQVIKRSTNMIELEQWIHSFLKIPICIYYSVELKNAFLKIEAAIKSEVFLKYILQNGMSQLLTAINHWNVQNVSDLKIIWRDTNKTVTARASIYAFNILHILQNITSNLLNIEQFLLGFVGYIASAFSQRKPINAENSEMSAIRRSILQMRALLDAQLKGSQFDGTVGEGLFRQKQAGGKQGRWGKQQQIEENCVRLQRKEQKQRNILRYVKIMAKYSEHEELLNCGNNCTVKRAKFAYYQFVNQSASLNYQSNPQIFQAEKQFGGDTNELQVEKKQKKEGLLIQKRPTSIDSRDFGVEKKIVFYLRNQKCSKIATYYSQQMFDNQNVNEKCLYVENYPLELDQVKVNSNRRLDILIELIEGLIFLHKHSIIHRDLKFQNILLSKELRPKIIDFGSGAILRKPSEENPLRTTRFYNCFYEDLPQNLRSTISRQSFERHPKFDIYSFGRILESFCLDFSAKEQMGEFVWGNLLYLGESCSELNPDFRLPASSIYLFLKYLRGYTRLSHYKR